MTVQGNQREAALYAYLAGIIDGEGCLRIAKRIKQSNLPSNQYRYNPEIKVGMGCAEICELLLQTFGGHVYTERVRPGFKTIHRWVMTSRRGVIKVLKKVLPHLIEKREQAELLLDYCKRTRAPENCKSGVSPEELQFREECYLKVAELKRTGAPATTEREDTREGEATV